MGEGIRAGDMLVVKLCAQARLTVGGLLSVRGWRGLTEGSGVQTTVSGWGRRPVLRRVGLGARAKRRGRLAGFSPVVMLLTQAAVLIVALLLAVAFLTATHRGRLYPDVEIGGVPVGGLSTAEATLRITERTATVADAAVTLRLGERTWIPSLAELGIVYDVAGSVELAKAFGRDHHSGAGLLHAAGLASTPYGVPIIVRFDEAGFDAYLDTIQDEIALPPSDATLAIDWTQPVVTPAVDGQSLDRAALREALLARALALDHVEPISLPLPVLITLAEISTAEVMVVADRIKAVLAAPFLLSVGDESWTIAPEDLAAMTAIETVTQDGDPTVVARLDQRALADVIAKLARRIDRGEAVDARVEDLDTHLKLHPASQVRQVDQPAAILAIQSAFAAGAGLVELPLLLGSTPGVATEHLMAEYGVTTLLASGSSDFAGSDPNRARNIWIATERIDGTLIPPYGTYSYNDSLGWIVDVPGFVEAPATTNGIFQIEVGGGVCQVSTTVFRSALLAGFPIVEWWPHVYRSAYYESDDWSPGYDASIAQVAETPSHSSDFRFRNPTDGWLLIRAKIDGTVVRVDLYGPDTGFTVELTEETWGETPTTQPIEIVDGNLRDGVVIEEEAPLPGLTVTVNRRVYDRNGDLWWEDSYTSTYAPQGGLYRVSPDMEGTTT